MGELFIKTLKDTQEQVEITSSVESNADSVIEPAAEPEVFVQIRKILLRKNNSQIFTDYDAKMIKLMMIHAFMIRVLETREQLKRYLFYLKLQSKDLVNIPDLSVDVVDTVLAYTVHDNSFPLFLKNQPYIFNSIQEYEKWEKLDIAQIAVVVSKSTEVLVLNLCNCLFFDTKKLCYSTEKLDSKSPLHQFYANHKKLYTKNDEIANEWMGILKNMGRYFTGENYFDQYYLSEIMQVKNLLKDEILWE